MKGKKVNIEDIKKLQNENKTDNNSFSEIIGKHDASGFNTKISTGLNFIDPKNFTVGLCLIGKVGTHILKGTKGKEKGKDIEKMTLISDTGAEFILPDHATLEVLKKHVGERVKIIFDGFAKSSKFKNKNVYKYTIFTE